MLAHNLKNILEILPEALPMVKRASIEEEFPTNNKDSVAASYLRMNYLTKVAKKEVDSFVKERLIKAASLYGLKDRLDEMSKRFDPQLEKTAEERTFELMAEFELSVNGLLSLEKTAALAEEIREINPTLRDERIARYSGNGWLNKEAAIKTLANRFYATKDIDFVKLASTANRIRENDFDNIRSLCKIVTGLDKRAGLDVLGFNFYKEALITKEASMRSCLGVNLAGETLPYEKVEAFGKDRIGSLLGPDVSKELGGDPVTNKYVLESLPRDSQLMLKASLKGV